MKSVKQVKAVVVDYGSFTGLAERLAEEMDTVYYYTPCESEFKDVTQCCKGDGLEKVIRIEDFMDPEIFDQADLFVFPDIGWSGHQKFLRRAGKAVWGSMGADELELYRTRFLETVKALGLPTIPSVTVRGLTKLREHLRGVKNKYVKINKWRAQMETFHHIDWMHTGPELDRLAVEFGPLQEETVFVVQDDLPTQVEIGYDGWTVDGQYPAASFQGYEKKNELYLGSQLTAEKLPAAVKRINQALAPLFKKYQYRNFFATEIRVGKDGKPYFIDPTMRMPGQTGEQLLRTCKNLPEVIWRGANGELVKPVFNYKFAAEATMHYTAGGDWWVLKVPEKVRPWTSLYHFCELDGYCVFPPKSNDEPGVVIGGGDTIQKAFEHLKANLEMLKGEPVKCRLEGFADLLRAIEDAEKHGVEFTSQPIPGPELVLAK